MRAEALDQIRHRQAFAGDLFGAPAADIGRQQVILPVALIGVPGVIEQHHRIFGHIGQKCIDCLIERGLAQIFVQLDLEIRAQQGRGHGAGVIRRVFQQIVRPIVPVSDHQRMARLFGGGERGYRSEDQKTDGDAEPANAVHGDVPAMMQHAPVSQKTRPRARVSRRAPAAAMCGPNAQAGSAAVPPVARPRRK